ncbi:MAG TPA: transaldolase [Candidatus Binataceae bacterium]|nr:transaldolase [Candidatus Binataceae bacterium]
MADNPLKQLEKFNQSPWLDFIRRSLLSSPDIKRMLDEDGLKGMTSNPTIFEKAIDGSNDYDAQFEQLVAQGKNVDEIYEALTIQDIQSACDVMRPLYDSSNSKHGYVSYEVSPVLANDTQGTIDAARRYWKRINKPNVMIKVPSTPEGLPAITTLISEGINVNVTLMFSMKHYDNVAEAYIKGIEKRVASGGAVDRIFSVASFFVSRVETLVDKKIDEKLKQKNDPALAALKGQAAVANTRLVYQRYKEIFHGQRFAAMRAKGARTQWPLWASTGTKDTVHYSDVKYVDELIGAETVNTMPPATMDAFREHGKPAATLESKLDEARDIVNKLKAAGIDLLEVGEELQDEGVALFKKSFEDLMGATKKHRDRIQAGEQRAAQ